MTGPGQVSWRAIGGEMTALGTAAFSLPLRWFVSDEHLDRADCDLPPVVFVHGLFGDPTNFLTLRRALGERSFASLSYRPRLDYQRLAGRLAELIARVRTETGADQVDVVGHSLGGFVARFLLESGEQTVRRLVTLGSPHANRGFRPNELAIFAAHDELISLPDPAASSAERVRIVSGCGHVGLLYHPTVVDEVSAYLRRPATEDRRAA